MLHTTRVLESKNCTSDINMMNMLRSMKFKLEIKMTCMLGIMMFMLCNIYGVLVKDMMFHAEYYDVVYVKDYIISCYNV
jgi:hypothetical protein